MEGEKKKKKKSMCVFKHIGGFAAHRSMPHDI